MLQVYTHVRIAMLQPQISVHVVDNATQDTWACSRCCKSTADIAHAGCIAAAQVMYAGRLQCDTFY